MVGLDAKVGEEQGFATWMRAAAVRLHSHKHSVDLSKGLGIVGFQYPALLVGVVLVEDAEVDCLIPLWPSATPRLEAAAAWDPWLLIQILGVQNERFALGVEDAPKGLLGVTRLGHVIYFGDV